MNVIVHPHPLKGSVEIPSSKSYAHRLLIAAALSDESTEVGMNALNEDILATASCLEALGSKLKRTQSGYLVHPISRQDSAELFCGESGSTLRFMLPVAAALGTKCTFTGAGRLPERPNAPLINALNAHGAFADSDHLPLHLSGKLTGGRYLLPGNISSQYITGLMLALPLCDSDSEIVLTTPLESASYIAITLETLRPFGIRIDSTESGWRIPGGQHYRSPGRIDAEGDWSSAAFWFAGNHLGSEIECRGLNPNSVQGDRRIVDQLNALGGEIDVSDTPDLVPALSVAAARYPGVTRITGAARLRLKESDRLHAVSEMLARMGAEVSELQDGLIISGGDTLSGAVIDGYNDHRIVMAAAIAATAANAPITISDAQAVRKSYPAFFETFNALGGQAYVESDR